MEDDFFENKLSRKFMISTARTMHYCTPDNDRDAEIISIAYIGAMNKYGIPIDDIAKITIGIQSGYKDLLDLVMKE